MDPYLSPACSIISINIATQLPAMAYIQGINFVSGTSSNVSAPADYPIILKPSTNQNARAGGRYIYLCYQTTDVITEALTGITLTADYRTAIPTPNGYTQLPQDLNDGAGGKWIYACYTRDDTLPALTELKVLAGGSRHVYPEDDTWVRINQDTNDGAGGDYIYICYKRARRS